PRATATPGLPSSIDGVAAIKLVNEKFPFGQSIRLDVVVTEANRADVQAAIASLKDRILAIPGVSGPTTGRTSADGTAQLLSFHLSGGRNDEANRAIVRQVRGELRPEFLGPLASTGAQMYVAGQAAATLDVVGIYTD